MSCITTMPADRPQFVSAFESKTKAARDEQRVVAAHRAAGGLTLSWDRARDRGDSEARIGMALTRDAARAPAEAGAGGWCVGVGNDRV